MGTINNNFVRRLGMKLGGKVLQPHTNTEALTEIEASGVYRHTC